MGILANRPIVSISICLRFSGTWGIYCLRPGGFMMDVQTGRLWSAKATTGIVDQRGRNHSFLSNLADYAGCTEKILTTPFTRLDEAGSPESPAPYSPMDVDRRQGKIKGSVARGVWAGVARPRVEKS